jgi:hypothetical protein
VNKQPRNYFTFSVHTKSKAVPWDWQSDFPCVLHFHLRIGNARQVPVLLSKVQ